MVLAAENGEQASQRPFQSKSSTHSLASYLQARPEELAPQPRGHKADFSCGGELLTDSSDPLQADAIHVAASQHFTGSRTLLRIPLVSSPTEMIPATGLVLPRAALDASFNPEPAATAWTLEMPPSPLAPG